MTAMGAPTTITLVDELADQTVELVHDVPQPAADLVAARLVVADHPRNDFRSRPLTYWLVDQAGAELGDEATVAGPATVTLTSPDAGEIIERRNRWLADIEARGTATKSVSSSTHLALIERTESRLDDVQRLRAMVDAQRLPPPPSPYSNRWRSRALLLGVLAAVVLVVGAVGLLVLGGDDEEAASGSGSGPDSDEVVLLPVELELEIGRGERNSTTFSGSEGQNVTILMLAQPAGPNQFLDPELELFDPGGVQIGYNDDRLDQLVAVEGPDIAVAEDDFANSGLDSRIDVTLPADGEYTVVSGALGNNGSGRYLLVIEEGGPGGVPGLIDGPGPIFRGEEEAMAIEEPACPPIGTELDVSLPYAEVYEAQCGELLEIRFSVEEPTDLLVAVFGGGPPVFAVLFDGEYQELEVLPIEDGGEFVIPVEPGQHTLQVDNLFEPQPLEIVIEPLSDGP